MNPSDRQSVNEPKSARRYRWFVFGIVAALAVPAILTSGPRSIEGYAAMAESGASSAEEAPSDPSIPAFTPTDSLPAVLWDVLAGLDYQTGQVADSLQGFVGKDVRIPGFMVPLEDFAEEVTEFLLVPYVGACVHTPPPPPNQLVYIKMKDNQKVKVSFWEPVWVHGELLLEDTEMIYGSTAFLQTGTKIEPYVW